MRWYKVSRQFYVSTRRSFLKKSLEGNWKMFSEIPFVASLGFLVVWLPYRYLIALVTVGCKYDRNFSHLPQVLWMGNGRDVATVEVGS